MRAVDKLHDIIDEEIASSKVSSTKTMLAGFSQGGALAIYAALTYHKRLAAVMVMSSWPVLRHTMPDVSILIRFLLCKMGYELNNNCMLKIKYASSSLYIYIIHFPSRDQTAD